MSVDGIKRRFDIDERAKARPLFDRSVEPSNGALEIAKPMLIKAK